MSLAYAPTTRNIDHTKFVALSFSFRCLATFYCLFSTLTWFHLQVRGRACDQYQKSNEYRRDSSQAQACPQLYRVHMGSQVIRGILGRHESVSSLPRTSLQGKGILSLAALGGCASASAACLETLRCFGLRLLANTVNLPLS